MQPTESTSFYAHNPFDYCPRQPIQGCADCSLKDASIRLLLQENQRLQSQIDHPDLSSYPDMVARIADLEQQNKQLRDQQTKQADPERLMVADGALVARIHDPEKEMRKLRELQDSMQEANASLVRNLSILEG